MKTHYSTRIDKDLLEKLKKHSEKTMIPVARIIDKAIRDYLTSTNK